MISMRNVVKRYGSGSATTHTTVLENFNLDVQVGEFVALTGRSGVGKTTILNLIGGLDQPDAGDVVVGEAELHLLSSRQLARWRATHVGFVFQSHNLLGMLTAAENIELPLQLKPMSSAERARRVAEALRNVGLANRGTHRPAQLSGGQQQRVGIARAVIADAPLLLFDEPTGNLDRSTSTEILRLLHQLNNRGKTIVMVTHDPEIAGQATRQLDLSGGAS